MVDIADFQGRKHVDRLLILHSCTLSWMSIREFVQTSLIADSLIFSLTFCEEVFPCGTKSWFTALTLAASLEGISMQSRSWTGSLASEDRVEFSVC